jgi:hypothetical protein
MGAEAGAPEETSPADCPSRAGKRDHAIRRTAPARHDREGHRLPARSSAGRGGDGGGSDQPLPQEGDDRVPAAVTP